MHGLAFGQHPNICRDTRVVKQVGGQLNNGFYQIAFNDMAADFRCTGARITCEQGRSVLNDCHSAGAEFHLFHAVQHKQHLTIGDSRQTGTETTIKSLFSFCFNLGLFALPVDTEGRIGNDVVELIAGKGIVTQSVAILHAGCIAAFDEHISLCDSISFGVELLTKAGQSSILADILQALGQTTKHLGSAHSHIVGCLGAAFLHDLSLFRSHQQFGH